MPKIFNPLSNRIVYENGKTGKMIKCIIEWNNLHQIKKIAKILQETQFLKIVRYYNPYKIQSAKKILRDLKIKMENEELFETNQFQSLLNSNITQQLSRLFETSIQYYVPYMHRILNKSKLALNQKYIEEYIARCKITKKCCDCVICLEYHSKKHNVIRLHCNHEFHEQCISQWFSQAYTCPICKMFIQKYEPRIHVLDEI